MNDGSSQELPNRKIKSEPHNSSESFAKKVNPLGMSEVNYNELPWSFEVGEEFVDAVNLVRQKTEIEKTEVGGVLMKDQAGKLGFKTAGGKGDPFPLNMAEITDKNLDFSMKAQALLDFPAFTEDIVFVSKMIADNNPHYFKRLIDMGAEVVLDRVPAGVLHSHPSGNLPSTGDFIATVIDDSLSSSTSIPEIVVTSEYTYFLFPTKQTVALTSETLRRGTYEKWVGEENETVNHLAEIDKANGVKNPNVDSHINAFRYNFLRNHCLENNVGFYALKNGEKNVQRVF
jgi:hypothetical protein